MQEVFEKIIERLEELHERYIKQYGVVGGNPMAFAVKECIDIVELIVNQEAEKFGTDTNVGSNGWILCSDRLPKNDCYCLVTTSDMEIGIREYGYSKGFGWDGFERIIAWQPLPKPYQPKGE